MLRIAWMVALVCAAAGCKERNPEYCDRGSDCPSGTCRLAADGGLSHFCVPGPDALLLDARLPDAGVPCGADARTCDNPFPICGVDRFCRGCTGATECVAGDPVCMSGSCDLCTMSSQCAGRDAGTICNVASGGCVQCVKDADCPASLCDLDAHVCLAPASVLYVDATKTTTDCTLANPCPAIGAALAKTSATGRSYIRVAAGNYAESLSITDRDVVIAGASGAMLFPRVQGEVPVTASGTAKVWLRKLGITGGNPATRCTGTSLRLSDVTIAGSEGVGVDASMCDLTVERTIVRGSAQTGINLGTSATFHIHDSVVMDGQNAGVALSSTGAGNFDSNTVIRNLHGGVSCVSTPPTLTFNGDIVWGNGDSQIFGCAWNYSDIGPGTLQSGPGNTNVDPLFQPATDYHLGPTSPCINADPHEKGAGTDVDGDARPRNGTYDIGADEAG